jgi:hypothetical protein
MTREVSAMMAVEAPLVSGDTAVVGYLRALLAQRPHLSVDSAWPVGLWCDVVDAPLDGCCGAIAHLARAGVGVCPIAQIWDRMLFLVAVSEGPVAGPLQGLPPGVLVRRVAAHSADDTRAGETRGCWVVPPDCAASPLPPPEAVLTALAAARIEHQASMTIKIT